MIAKEILKMLPRIAVFKMANLNNVSFRLKYVPKMCKVAEIIMIPKTGKLPHEVTSY